MNKIEMNSANNGIKELTINETMEVGAGIGWPGAAAGGIYGGLGYLGGAAVSGDFNWGSFGTSIAGGAAMGAIGGPIGSAAGRYLAPRVSFATGAITGLWN